MSTWVFEPGHTEVEFRGASQRGPSDATAVLDLFDRRFRDVRSDDESYSSEDAVAEAGRRPRAMEDQAHKPDGIGKADARS